MESFRCQIYTTCIRNFRTKILCVFGIPTTITSKHVLLDVLSCFLTLHPQRIILLAVFARLYFLTVIHGRAAIIVTIPAIGHVNFFIPCKSKFVFKGFILK